MTTLTAVSAVAIPVAVFGTALMVTSAHLQGRFDRYHAGLFLATVGVLAVAVGLAVAGAQLSMCLVIVAAGPAISVVVYETTHKTVWLGVTAAVGVLSGLLATFAAGPLARTSAGSR